MGFGALSVKGRALRYLAQREHSRVELERKLARHVEDQPEASAQQQIAAALDELAAKGLLSDQRAADAVLCGQGARFGSRRLKQTLQTKGLEPALVAGVLQQARATELERAREVWRRSRQADALPGRPWVRRRRDPPRRPGVRRRLRPLRRDSSL